MTEEQQRQELHSKIWKIADDVRGAVDGWDFKQYVLGILFYRFISENFQNYIENGDPNFDYRSFPEERLTPEIKDDAIKTKGYFIMPSQLFSNVVEKANTNENLNTDLKAIFDAIEASAVGYASEKDIKGLFDDIDTTSNRLGNTVTERNQRLADVLKGIAELNFGSFEDNKIDLFGDAYEYLISNYASNAGKSGGEFFTPQTVSNPPYSIKWVGSDDPILINDDRFAPAGVLAPKSKADFAFIMHSLSYLSSKGRAAIVTFPGIFYRGGAEQKIRKYLVDNNFVEAVIQLPDNLFFGTSIATCILVLAKNKTSTDTFFIDAGKEFKKATNNNILTEENIKTILSTFASKENKKYFAESVPYEKIVENDYNLSVSTYVEKEDTREKIDIDVLNKEIAATVQNIDKLRSEIDKIVEELQHGQ
ncbi:type I restriction-modification system subunit M [Streptococcus sobrinus]|uniref:type I restriction-modification system subunit M n=1 Tax=Streptococcus sobrinus TaxID=1310 RepID=UPI0002FF4A9A|nr:type I restriction-modification system subunit M [Streptococcus sobrinus]